MIQRLEDEAEILAGERVGSVLDGKWTLERLLGVGGMAAVYAARHRNGARAALKLLHAELARHQEVRERFVREGYAANRVEHPGAVRVLDDDVVSSGPEAGQAYIVMELLEGQSLQDRLESGPPVGEIEFLEIADGVLDVLAAAHGRGVVHRDLKPENLFLVHEGEAIRPAVRVKVLDFGLARLLDGQAITTYGLALGTPSFMSPEQAAGRIDEIDGRTDLFALAATGFRLRTGRRIHEAPNAIELVGKMANLAAPRIQSVAADVSEPYARIIDRALAFRREDRYGDATAMQADVRSAMSELFAGAGPTRVAVPVGLSGGASNEHEPTTLQMHARDLPPAAPPLKRLPAARRSRRSIIPWVALVLVGGVGARLGWEHRTSVASRVLSAIPSPPQPPPQPPREPPLPEPSTNAAVAEPRPAESAIPVVPASSAPLAGSAPAAASSAAAHATPARVGPGHVRKLQHKRRGTTAKPAP